MSLEAFQKSEALSLGVELELQLVNTHDFDLAPYAEDMLRMMKKIRLPGAVVPEMTSSMIEVSTGVCKSSAEVLSQLTQIRDALVKCADKLNIAVVGGGTHPFQQWHERRIYDKPRFRESASAGSAPRPMTGRRRWKFRSCSTSSQARQRPAAGFLTSCAACLRRKAQGQSRAC